MDDKDAARPVFRKPSLTYEADAAIAGSVQLATSASTDSLANNTYGTTFAARARAAELQAARARKLKENSNQTGLPSADLPHEVMTFTKARTTRGRTWKTLNLHDLPEVSMEYIQSIEYQTPSNIKTTDRQIGTQYGTAEQDLHRQFFPTEASLGPSHETLRIGAGSSSRQSQNLSLDTKSQSESATDYAASLWDPELPTREKRAETSGTYERPEPRTRTSSASLTLFTLPVLASSSDRMQKEGDYLRQKQESLLQTLQAELQAGLQKHDFSEQAMIGTLGHDDPMEPLMGLMSQHHALEQPTAALDTASNDEDSFVKFPLSNSPPASAMRHAIDEVNNHRVFPNRHFIPNQYAAVKGTMGHISRPQQERMHKYEPYSQQRFEHSARIQDPIPQHPSNVPYSPQIPYRKLSAEEKKDRLLQQLHAVADESNNTGNMAGSGRTVLHDPFAYIRHKDTQSELSSTIHTSSERDLVMTSDPLPWKDRPVNVVSTSPLHPVKYSDPGAGSSSPTAARPIQIAVSYEEHSVYSRGLSVEEVEQWWRQDSRIDVVTQKNIDQILDRISEETHVLNGGGSTRLSVKNSVDRFERPKPTTASANLQSRALSDNVLIPVLSNLATYLQTEGYFNRHGKAPDWCIDQGSGGQSSFFGEDWGVPPPRVGRDPRYQPVFHEGTRSVYSDFGGRRGSHGYIGKGYR